MQIRELLELLDGCGYTHSSVEGGVKVKEGTYVVAEPIKFYKAELDVVGSNGS